MNNIHLFINLFTISNIIINVQLDSILQERQKVNDFVFNLAGSSPQTSGLGGNVKIAFVDQFPSLKGQGLSCALFYLDPCAINLPHAHPRATEIIYLFSGTLKTAFVEENGGRTVVNTLKTGQVTFFPRGLIHEQQNIGCEPAVYFSALGNEDPGVITVASRLFTLPEDALKSTFKLNSEQIDAINKTLPAVPAKGFDTECMTRCKIV